MKKSFAGGIIWTICSFGIIAYFLRSESYEAHKDPNLVEMLRDRGKRLMQNVNTDLTTAEEAAQ